MENKRVIVVGVLPLLHREVTPMVASPIEVMSREPAEFSDLEIHDFMAFVVAGGEVAVAGLEKRIRSAARLAFLFVGSTFSGVAALKRPEAVYRDSVASKAKVPLPKKDFPYELGYVFVMPSTRRRGFSFDLAQEALVSARGKGVFATTRTNNGAMQATLEKCKFKAQGRPYPSTLGTGKLQLFVRPSDQ